MPLGQVANINGRSRAHLGLHGDAVEVHSDFVFEAPFAVDASGPDGIARKYRLALMKKDGREKLALLAPNLMIQSLGPSTRSTVSFHGPHRKGNASSDNTGIIQTGS
jgi:hypothetical protein